MVHTDILQKSSIADEADLTSAPEKLIYEQGVKFSDQMRKVTHFYSRSNYKEVSHREAQETRPSPYRR